MKLKHQGCRIGITAKAGNELHGAVVCLDAADYAWEDNAADAAHDDADKWADAQDKADAVRAVYERMCETHAPLQNLKSGMRYVYDLEIRRGMLAVIRAEINPWQQKESLVVGADGTITN